MHHRVTVLNTKQNIEAVAGESLMRVLRDAGIAPDAPCGGNGTCGKCTVLVDGIPVLACRTVVDRDMTVAVPEASQSVILTEGIGSTVASGQDGYLLAFDIGTTTVAGYLLDGKTGKDLASHSRRNPQAVFGADVISRIGHALDGQASALTESIRKAVEEITMELCRQAQVTPEQIRIVSLVGNPAMQQLYYEISVENLARIPFAPALTRAKVVDAQDYLPVCPKAKMLIIPDISGFVGADTVACVMATALDKETQPTLLVDIGTNGEMVLTDGKRMVACSTAAGPALEGANIRFGMRAQAGAIDHVFVENRRLTCSVIGGGEALGICGSGIIDAVAAALDLGLLNARGKVLTESGIIPLTDRVSLTQEDIRQVQLAKGAVAAGIAIMAAHLDLHVDDIQRVYLAGAFGTYMRPEAACRIGLLPAVLKGKITAVGNAAGSGAKMIACDPEMLAYAQTLVDRVGFVELAAQPRFNRCFADHMRF
jgi:uncharacterized 2Fe-2S/4Fe-4S cluster protein (DUF4445 family)